MRSEKIMKWLDEWHPTIVRYLGIVFMGILIVSAVRGHVDYPAGFVAAGGMILYKSIAGGSNGR